MKAMVLAALVGAMVMGTACKDRQSPGGGSGSGSGSGSGYIPGVENKGGGPKGGPGSGAPQPGRSTARSASGKTYDEELKDAYLIAKVGAKMGVLKMLTIRVDADKGKVTLTGPVATAKDKTDIEAAARATEGVTTVISELKVAP